MALAGDSIVTEWRPGAREGAWWTLVSLGLVVVGLVLFAIPLLSRTDRVDFEFAPIDVAILAVLTAALIVLHEGIHGVTMKAFGATPFFGIAIAAGVIPSLYTTAPGYRFSRRQYLAVALAPAVLISLVGFAVSFTLPGPSLFIPLALHLGGCAGDAAAARQVLTQPPGTVCEDLRDGIRFHRTSKGSG